MAKLYGWGASVVILGALFKINHYEGANLMLIIGLGTEALIFFFSAFEPPYVEPDWSVVYPELKEIYHGKGYVDPNKVPAKEPGQNKGQSPGGNGLDKLLSNANINQEMINDLGKGLQNLSDNAKKMNDLSQATVATNEFVSNVKNASESAGDLSSAYRKAAESINHDRSASEEYMKNMHNASESVAQLSQTYSDSAQEVRKETQQYTENVKKITENLSSLNTMYEMQLKNSDGQAKASSQLQSSIEKFLADLNQSAEQTEKYKEQVNALTEKVSALNTVYGNMLTAMNVKSNNK
ncbi:MAG: gliding motility protein GldL [Bacteroidales bacterium]|nr:gliding motility protein GldL [Bacteroidales bacterium]